MISGFCPVSFTKNNVQFNSALVLAMPFAEMLTIDGYEELKLEEQLVGARHRINDLLWEISNILCRQKVDYYFVSVPQQSEESLAAELSFKTLAVNAGIGWCGKNDLLITEQYGPRVSLAVVLMAVDIGAGNSVQTENGCPADCHECVDACPHGLISGASWREGVNRSELIDYQACNRVRSAAILELGRKSACGLCLVACRYGT